MRNIHEVLQQKEEDLERVRQEVEALRLVAPLLASEETLSNKQVGSGGAVRREATTGKNVPEQKWP